MGADRADVQPEFARLLQDQLEELKDLLERWTSRISQMAQPVPGPSDHTAPAIPELPGKPPPSPAPGSQPAKPDSANETELAQPLECLPAWQEQQGHAEADAPPTGKPGRASLKDKRQPEPDRPAPVTPAVTVPPDLPGVLHETVTTPPPSPAAAPKTKPGGRRSFRSRSRTFLRKDTRKVETSDDNRLRTLASGVKNQEGRAMMQQYDLTNNFDRNKGKGTVRLTAEGRWNDLFNAVHSKTFTMVSSFLIFLNATLIGIQMNSNVIDAIAGRRSSDETLWFAIEVAFMVIFSVELLLRALAERNMFWVGLEWKWNMLDLGLIIISLVDLGTSEASTMPNVGQARTLRVLRFTRLLRIVRVMRFFQSFRLMVYSILNSLSALLWVFLLLLFVLYFFAAVFVHGVTEHFKSSPAGTALSDALADNFGTLFDALLSLFAAICGGKDWFDVMKPLMDMNWLYGLLFLVYVFFVIFGVLNVVVGTFVDTAYQVSQKDRDYVVQCEVERNKKYMEDIKTFFYEADSDGSGMLTLEEFETHLQKDKVKAYFQALELDISQARALFLLLDADGSNEIELEEFIGGCMRMKGDAKSIDVNMLLYLNERMLTKMGYFMDFVVERFDRLETAVGLEKGPPFYPSHDMDNNKVMKVPSTGSKLGNRVLSNF